MFRYSPRRSRSRGFKVKHVLQLFLFVSVSIWLLYQIRHSREQKSEFDDSARSAKESIKLGRKDLLPRIDDTITKDEDRDNNIIVDHFKPEGTGNVEIKAGVGDGLSHDHENHVRGEVDSRYKPLYGKHEKEDSAKEETEEESKEEETEEAHEDKETEEGKESGEENEGEENKEEGEAEIEDSENKSSDGNDSHDEPAHHHKGDESESHNITTGNNEHGQVENSHEFVQWSNTNSTEAYIHQDERARNMRETETEAGTRGEGKRNRTSNVSPARFRRNNSAAIKRNVTNLKSGNISSPRNLIPRARNSTLNRREAETRKYNSSSTGKPLIHPRGGLNSTYPSRKFMFRRQIVKSNASAETGKNYAAAAKNQEDDSVSESRTGSNTKNTTGYAYKKQVESNDHDHDHDHHNEKSLVSHERDESAGADDVQKLKEMVDYSSVIKKEDESPEKNRNKDASADSDSHSLEDGEGDNGASDDSSSETSNPQEEKDGRTDLKSMAGSVAEGRSSQ